MCRAGGRRCQGSNHSSRATQTTRKAVSRAKAALREAKATGDPTAIDTARQRLTDARDDHRKAKDTMSHNEKPAQPGDVTPPTDDQADTAPPRTAEPTAPLDTPKTVRVQGTCPNGHVVWHNLPLTGAAGSSQGFAVVSADCPTCGRPVTMHGSYTNHDNTPGQTGDVTTPTDHQPDTDAERPVPPHVAAFEAKMAQLGLGAPRPAAGRQGDVTDDAPDRQTSTQDSGGRDRADDGFNRVGTVHGDVHTYGDVVHHGDTTTVDIRTDTSHSTPPTADPTRQRAERTARPSNRDADHVHGDVDQRRDTYHFGRSRTFTVSNVNTATGNATVGSQHDVTHEQPPTRPTTGHTGDVTDDTDNDAYTTSARPATSGSTHEAAQADLRARLRRVRARRRATRNEAAGDDHIDVQIGLQIGDVHRRHDTD